MNRTAMWVVVTLVALSASSVQAQCQGGGGQGGRTSGASQGMGMSSGMAASGGTMLTSPGSWAYDQMLNQAMQRQAALARYQKAMEDQAKRAESLKRRQYYAAQRREQKLKQSPAGSQSQSVANRAANRPSFSSVASLEFSPSNR